MTEPSLKIFLDRKLAEFNQPAFIMDDPVSIPHRFTNKADIEIAGFFAATFSWGNRKTIINKSLELMALMDHAPYEFCLRHQDKDLKRIVHFSHRTFNATDLLYFVAFFNFHFSKHKSLETAFTQFGGDIENMLKGFHHYFFSLPDIPQRTRNISPSELICPVDLHVARVAKKLGLLHSKSTGWKAAMELTKELRKLDQDDPVKYDLALFGMGIIDKF
jgi:hypothetical protein